MLGEETMSKIFNSNGRRRWEMFRQGRWLIRSNKEHVHIQNTLLAFCGDKDRGRLRGEDRQHHPLRYVTPHLAQLLGQLPGLAEEAQDVPPLAGCHHVVCAADGVAEVLERAADDPVPHHLRLLEQRQQVADPAHELLDAAALLLVLPNGLHGIRDDDRDLNDLLNNDHWISHPGPGCSSTTALVLDGSGNVWPLHQPGMVESSVTRQADELRNN